MRLKSRLNKQLKVKKCPRDEKVPVAWEQGKDIPRLPYKEPEVIHETELDNFLRPFLKPVIKHKVSEEQFWCCEGHIEEIKFEHATVQNVDFEWGTFGRAVR